MTPDQKEMLNTELAKFGASLTDGGLFQKGNRVISSVQVKIEKNRLRFENRMNGDLLSSGPVTARTISSFVKKFWYWEKI